MTGAAFVGLRTETAELARQAMAMHERMGGS